jgi:hypothetical protein
LQVIRFAVDDCAASRREWGEQGVWECLRGLGMNRKIAVFAAAFAAFAVCMGPSAQAGSRNLLDQLNPFAGPVATAGTVAGAGTTAGYFAINHWKWHWDAAAAGISQAGAMIGTTIGCAAISPMIATVLAKRELTFREADKLAVGCVIPFVGPMIVDALYDAHPDWEQVHLKKAHYRRRHHRRHR